MVMFMFLGIYYSSFDARLFIDNMSTEVQYLLFLAALPGKGRLINSDFFIK